MATAEGKLGFIEGQNRLEVSESIWRFGDEDWALIAQLQDPIFCAELLFEDPRNREYGGCYHVIDYQYPLFRPTTQYQGFPCARSVGKTESMKARAVSHVFRRVGEPLLVTAPELIHLSGVGDPIEARITETRLTREMLDTRDQKTGFNHKSGFEIKFLDKTRIVGRIPKLSGPQPLDARVLTPSGWTTMGELRPGHMVVGPSGEPTEVLAVTNEWVSDVFRVEFTDGSSTLTDAKHRWRVRTDSKAWHILYTEEIAAALAGPAKKNGGTLNMVRVPQQGVVQYEQPASHSLALHPYVVGALLGDGAISQRCAQLICADEEIVKTVEALLPPDCSLTQVHPIKFLLVGPGRGKRNPVLLALRDLGLLGHTAHTKFIPDRLKHGSVDERLDVLRGLLDTDGTVKDAGAAHLVSASKRLIADAAEIVRSLGGWASVGSESKVAGATYHRGTFRINGMVPFLLERKRSKYKADGRQRHRSIRAVTPAGRKRVKCIKVAAEDESYLTDDLLPTLNTGVKGQHQPDLMIEEAQDYPEKGWIEVSPTVMRDHIDKDGKPDFTFHFYGVHSPAKDNHFYKLTNSGEYKIYTVTAIMRPGWGPAEKRAMAAMYGGTTSPDYRRNVLGEAGSGANAFFVTSRLMSCMDQNRESRYNEIEWKRQELRADEIDKTIDPTDPDFTVGNLLDLPDGLGQQVFMGADIGLVNDPTVITLWHLGPDSHRKSRLKLVRMFHLWEFREKQIRQCFYAIAHRYGVTLRSNGMDVTGLGLPIFQAMGDDEYAPKHLLEISQGYVFNAKMPIGIDPSMVSEDNGRLRDQYGNMVEVEEDPFTGEKRYIVKMTMIEASTRYLREWVDTGHLMLPFDTEVIGDMQGETEQRVRAMAGSSSRKKVNAFHILDSMRAMAMARKHEEVMAQVAAPEHTPVMDQAVTTVEPDMAMGAMWN